MKLLETQEQFEELLGKLPPSDPAIPLPRFTAIYFTAKWCGACKALNLPSLEDRFPQINWLKCDIDQNEYTAGYCGIRSIPTFLLVADKIVIGPLTSNNTEKVADWIGAQYAEWSSGSK